MTARSVSNRHPVKGRSGFGKKPPSQVCRRVICHGGTAVGFRALAYSGASCLSPMSLDSRAA